MTATLRSTREPPGIILNFLRETRTIMEKQPRNKKELYCFKSKIVNAEDNKDSSLEIINNLCQLEIMNQL